MLFVAISHGDIEGGHAFAVPLGCSDTHDVLAVLGVDYGVPPAGDCLYGGGLGVFLYLLSREGDIDALVVLAPEEGCVLDRVSNDVAVGTKCFVGGSHVMPYSLS